MIAAVTPSFVIVGAGGISRAYAQALEEGVPFELAAICDVRREAAEELAEMTGAKAYDDVELMCEEIRPTAAIVCTPPATHPDLCIELMKRGIHVLCEKPLAISSREARRMIVAAETYNVVFTMGSKFRFVKDVQKARDIIASGEIGDVVIFENTFAVYVDMSQRWNSNPRISGGGVLIDNGTHSVDVLRFLLGRIVDLQVVEGRRIQNLAVEDTVRLFARTAGGAMGSIDLSWSLNKVQPHFISVYASNGTLQVGWQESRYRRAGDPDWTVFGSGYNKVEAFRNQLLNFIGAIRGEEDLIISSDDAIASVHVIETAYAALESDMWHAVSGPMERHRTEVRGVRVEK